MSVTPVSSTEVLIPTSNHRDSVAEFVRWGLAQLKFSWDETEGRATLPLGEADWSAFDGKKQLELAMEPGAETPATESIAVDGRFGKWLLSQLQSHAAGVNVSPSDQPSAVNDVVTRLFQAYRVDGGQVHLGGCQLEDMPFLRLTFPGTDEHGKACVCHLFVAHDGSSVSDELAEKVGMLEVKPLLERPPRIDPVARNALISSGRRIAVQSCSSRDPSAKIVDPLATAVVWVKRASGKLRFTIGETTEELPFSGWAKLIAAPPYVSRHSGASSFHLAATDDGRIDAADEITRCQHSGRRVLQQDLVTCAATGKRVLEEFTRLCPVTGHPALDESFRPCGVCREEVSSNSMQLGICAGCSSLSKISKDDPRLIWIISKHKALDAWNHWKMAETSSIYITEASGVLHRLLVVVDKESLEVRHLATAGRLASSWTPVPAEEYPKFLG